mmetsp:Transcript_24201/g.76734  ORF Transcript_24201/g.76734 Transcript_24201/m.76734 type:complete len:216 (+) Transcript_24201:815-1462(+)
MHHDPLVLVEGTPRVQKKVLEVSVHALQTGTARSGCLGDDGAWWPGNPRGPLPDLRRAPGNRGGSLLQNRVQRVTSLAPEPLTRKLLQGGDAFVHTATYAAHGRAGKLVGLVHGERRRGQCPRASEASHGAVSRIRLVAPRPLRLRKEPTRRDSVPQLAQLQLRHLAVRPGGLQAALEMLLGLRLVLHLVLQLCAPLLCVKEPLPGLRDVVLALR